MNKRLLTTLVISFSALLLTACGGGGGSDSDGEGGASSKGGYIQGVAATGKPYAGSDTIHVTCKGNGGIPMIIDADSEGNFGLSKQKFDTNDSQFPCSIALQGGGLSSYTSQAGRVNLTPFTSLAYARALFKHSGKLSSQVDVENLNASAFEAKLATAVSDLKAALNDSSGESASFDIFSEAFKADHNSEYDRWLDGFGEALKEDYPVPNSSFFTVFSSFLLKYSAQTDGASFDETATVFSKGSFDFKVPLPKDLAQYFKSKVGAGDYTLKIGISRYGGLDPINETVTGVALPSSKTVMCNKLQSDSIQVITDGQNLSPPSFSSCAWGTTPTHGWDKTAIVQYAPYGQAVFDWKQ